MSPLIRGLTLFMWALPTLFFFLAAFVPTARALAVPAVLLVAIYAWIWVRFRPSQFVIEPDAIQVIWPLKCRRFPRAGITAVRLIDAAELRQLAGWGMRVGAGGLWGGFGWLWTKRRGIVQMYISRTDRFVWLERGGERAWLITPEEPELFVTTLVSHGG